MVREETRSHQVSSNEDIICEVDVTSRHIVLYTQDKLVNNQYWSMYQAWIDRNERNQLRLFAGFNDGDMMYTFIHRPIHMDQDKQRTVETKKEYARDLFHFYQQLKESEAFLKEDVENFIEGSLFKNLRPRHIRRYQEYLQTVDRPNGKRGYSLATRARKVVILKSFLKWLWEIGYIRTALHTEFLSHSLRGEDRPNRDLSYEEVSKILQFYKKHPVNYAILSILATTGLRIQELANAQWKDLYYDPTEGRYFLRVMGKGKKQREVIIFHNVKERIQKFRARRGANTDMNSNENSPLILTRNDSAYDYKYLSRYVSDIIEKTELPFLKDREKRITPHFFRHFFAIYSLQQGASIEYIQQTLGHEDYKTTQIYLDKYLKRKNNVARFWGEENF
jgi:integrase/recombinase XerD